MVDTNFYRSITWINNTLSSPDRISKKEFHEIIKPLLEKREDIPIIKWVTWASISAPTNNQLFMQFFLPQNTLYPPMLKCFVVPVMDNQNPNVLPDIKELGLVVLSGQNIGYLSVKKTDKPGNFTIYVIAIPDIRDIERLVTDQPSLNDYLNAIKELPLSDQLDQEIKEALLCRDLKLHISTIATLAIAMETACKISLETNQIRYHRTSDGLNELLNKLVQNNLLSEKDRTYAISLKGMRNAVDHGHSGMVTKELADTFFVGGESIIKSILQKAVYN